MTTTVAAGGQVAQPPVQRTWFATSDPEEGTEFLRAQYTDFEPAYSPPAGFALDVASGSVASPRGSWRVDRVRHVTTAHAEVEPFDQFLVVSVVAGRWGVTSGRSAASGVALMPSWDRYTATWHDPDLLTCTLESDTVRRVGAELSGLAPGAVAFRAMVAVSPERARVFAALLGHFARDLLPHDEVLASPLVRAESVRHLVTTMLLTFPNTALDVVTDPTAPVPGRAEPATVRRATAFIDENAHEPVGLTEIAAAAGIGARGLQHAFRRYRDTTPLGYLRRVRLERAHRDLQVGDPTRGDTVAAAAARWGFPHPGRFSLEYRRVYGCSPSRTLRG